MIQLFDTKDGADAGLHSCAIPPRPTSSPATPRLR